MNLQTATVMPTDSNGYCSFSIPVPEYHELISLCDPSSLEYKNLKDGIIVDQLIHFLFDETTAQRLYKYALAKHPAAAKHIRESMRNAGHDLPF